jgi:hypothetical protein
MVATKDRKVDMHDFGKLVNRLGEVFADFVSEQKSRGVAAVEISPALTAALELAATDLLPRCEWRSMPPGSHEEECNIRANAARIACDIAFKGLVHNFRVLVENADRKRKGGA